MLADTPPPPRVLASIGLTAAAMILTSTSEFTFVGRGTSDSVRTSGPPVAAITIARIVVMPSVKPPNDSPVLQRCQLEANNETP